MNKQAKNILPTYSFYRRNCHSSHKNYLSYLASTTEIKVVRFDEDGDILDHSEIKIPQEAVKGIRIHVISETEYYVGVAFISRFIVFRTHENIYEANLSLDCNIAEFGKGFSGVEVFRNQLQESTAFHFLFLQRNGDIVMFDPMAKNKIMKTAKNLINQSFEAIAVLYPNVYLCTDQGMIVGAKIVLDSEHYEEIRVHEASAGLPVLEIVGSQEKQEVYCGTVYGQILILSKNMDKTALISTHSNLLCRILASGDRLLTFGEDCLLHKFQILGDRKLRKVQTVTFTKLPSLLFKLDSGNYVTFYESPKVVSI